MEARVTSRKRSQRLEKLSHCMKDQQKPQKRSRTTNTRGQQHSYVGHLSALGYFHGLALCSRDLTFMQAHYNGMLTDHSAKDLPSTSFEGRKYTTEAVGFAGSKEMGDLTLTQRLEAAALMVNLIECSSAVRGMFSSRDNERRELYTQLRDVRTKVKQ